MSSELIIGTAGSLFAMVVGWFSREFYEKIISPFADRATYKNALIEGEWETKLIFSDESYNVLQIKLARSGYRLSGKARCVEGYSAGHEFEFKGEFIPPLMTATYKAKSPHSTERGAIALMLNKNGRELRGHLVFSDDEIDGILANKCVLSRATTHFGW